MGGDFQYADIIVLAMIAAFIALRLRSVLGRRTGREEQPADVLARRAAGQPELALPRPAEPGTPLDAALARIRAADPRFDPATFANSAKAAYQMILEAFWKGESAELKDLLSDEVYSQFSAAIDARPADGKSLDSKVAGIDSATILEAGLDGNQAEITVRFLAELDEAGAGLRRVNDVWTFSRDVKSRGPNWYLIATASGE